MKENYSTPQPIENHNDSSNNELPHLSETNVSRILDTIETDDTNSLPDLPNLPELPNLEELPEVKDPREFDDFRKSKEYIESLPPLERFRVNPNDYPIFCQQSAIDEHWGNNSAHRWNIDRTLSTFVTNTAELIATIDGTSDEYERRNHPPQPDFLIYLDKSARPVSWLVNTFWDDFSKARRPPHSYLNVDRINWFHAAGVDVDAEGDIIRASGTREQATGSDFNPDDLPPDTFARIRALFLPDGIESEDPETIMNAPSILDGKNILIIDEVGKSGSTLTIAQKLIERACPEIGNVRGAYFWHPGYKADPSGTKRQMLSVPVWYDANTPTGRGIGDVNEHFYDERYNLIPNNKTRAQAYGAKILSAPIDLGIEDQITKFSSRELMREITKMHQDFQNGRILMSFPQNYDDDKFFNYLEKSAHLRLTAPDDPTPDNYVKVLRNIYNREPEW